MICELTQEETGARGVYCSCNIILLGIFLEKIDLKTDCGGWIREKLAKVVKDTSLSYEVNRFGDVMRNIGDCN